MGETSGCTPYFWGRGIGWVAMGLVDMLDFLPESYAGRDSIIDMFQDLCKAISEVQDPERHVWWQVLNLPAASGNYTESSASCMFVYAIAKGIRLGYLDNSFLPCIENGIQGIVNYFLDIVDEQTINITHLCPGQAPSFILSQYFLGQSQNGHAVGPFIGAMLETSEQHIYPAGINEDMFNNGMVFFNYPNPFSGKTIINLTIPDTRTVTLNVYNMLGQKVKELYSGIVTEGSHTFTFDGSTLQSGIYICSLKTGNNASYNRMILIR